ncbi:hypothetical protein ACTFIY_003891 [Dictyostelium cf. discoideum]
MELIITFYDFEKAFDSISQQYTSIIHYPKASYQRETKQGDPISPTIFALVVECMATILNDRCIKGVTKEAIKILQFADDTATTAYDFMDHFIMNEWIKKFCQATTAKINQNKCSCITFKWNTRTIYTIIKSTERYLGFDFNQGIKSKINTISDNIRAKLVTWNSTSSTYMGRLMMAKTYALSQLTFHTYINTTPLHNNIENEIVKFVFNTKSRNSLSVQRRQNNYINGGLNIWNLKIREIAQKAWIFERYLHQCASNTPISYIKLWQEELKNTNNTTPIEKNQLQLHLQCKQAWIQLRTPHHKQTHYQNLPKLKKIYEDMMTIKAPEHNKFIPTPGQKEILTKINSKHLPFKEIKRIINMKGRDLLWRFTLKALPKIYNNPCPHCEEYETSEHIFFNCKAHIKNTQEIFNYIVTNCGHPTHTWDIKILNQLQYSRQWNSPLHTITLPKHLKEYNNALSSLFK